jgi:hypothetical protein
LALVMLTTVTCQSVSSACAVDCASFLA